VRLGGTLGRRVDHLAHRPASSDIRPSDARVGSALCRTSATTRSSRGTSQEALIRRRPSPLTSRAAPALLFEFLRRELRRVEPKSLLQMIRPRPSASRRCAPRSPPPMVNGWPRCAPCAAGASQRPASRNATTRRKRRQPTNLILLRAAWGRPGLTNLDISCECSRGIASRGWPCNIFNRS
jgi:hypothetical protein